MKLRFYKDGEKASCHQVVSMEKEEKGVWAYRTGESLHGVYYDYELTFDGEKTVTGDPYARACGVKMCIRDSLYTELYKGSGWCLP